MFINLDLRTGSGISCNSALPHLRFEATESAYLDVSSLLQSFNDSLYESINHGFGFDFRESGA